MNPQIRMPHLLHEQHQRNDDVPDHEDREVGRSIVGALVAHVGAAGGTGWPHGEIAIHQRALATGGTGAPPAAPERAGEATIIRRCGGDRGGVILDHVGSYRRGRAPGRGRGREGPGEGPRHHGERQGAVRRAPAPVAGAGEDKREWTRRDRLSDKHAAEPVDQAYRSLLDEALNRELAHLDRREAEILRLRFGLGGGHEHTLSEIGKHVGLTRERVRQIQKEALAKLMAAPGLTRRYDPE